MSSLRIKLAKAINYIAIENPFLLNYLPIQRLTITFQCKALVICGSLVGVLTFVYRKVQYVQNKGAN